MLIYEQKRYGTLRNKEANHAPLCFRAAHRKKKAVLKINRGGEQTERGKKVR
jgi:gamma-glutamylcyclotransferase (GGCT)/AIG2-like uncharacterized protein YtfP